MAARSPTFLQLYLLGIPTVRLYTMVRPVARITIVQDYGMLRIYTVRGFGLGQDYRITAGHEPRITRLRPGMSPGLQD